MAARTCAILLLLLGAPGPALAQVTAEDLREAESLRDPERVREAPVAISVVDRQELQARPGIDLEEALDLVPGVFPQSSRNFAQDTRLSIRGFGASAPFGVRGIRVLVDGVPNTLPDGQSEVDSIDLAFMEQIEVVRGPISSLYGGGGGGIVSFSTVAPTEDPTFSARSSFGTNHLSRYETLARGYLGETGYVFGLARTRFTGYREHSRGEQTVGLAKLERDFADGSHGLLSFSAVWAPEAQDAGGLNATELATDRKQARTAARAFDTGEELDQQKVSFTWTKPLGENRELRVAGYQLWRDFSNTLPFQGSGLVEFDRSVSGGSLVYRDRLGAVSWLAGVDVDAQRDQRRRFDNLAGARGALIVEQSEQVTSVGPFAQLELELDCGLGLLAGVRYDWVEFEVGDRTVDPVDGDLSDRIRFRELSPRFGARYRLRPDLLAYANVSTAFQVPTTTELRPPDVAGGFDSSRKPERTLGAELGLKGRIGQRLHYDLALFWLRVRDALVPFEDVAGETFFKNAGEVRRRGVEFGLSAELRPGLSTRLGYTFSDFIYHDFDSENLATMVVTSFDGNRQPNVPRHSLGAELRWEHPSGPFAVLSLRHFSDLEVNDENNAESSGATISDARFGWRFRRGGLEIRPFAGARNWSGERYNGTVRPNAGFGRYYEPAPETELYGGLAIEFTLGRDSL